MRISVMVVLAFLLVPVALASPNYWVVVPASGNAMDVVNGANFAASMKGSAAVTFESREYVNAIEEVEEIDRDKLIAVTFIDDVAEVIAGDDPDSLVYDNVIVYLDEQGFTTIVIDVEDWRLSDDSSVVVTDDEIDDRIEREEEPELCTADVKECWDGSFVSRQVALECEFAPCPPEPVEDIEEPEPQEEPAEPEKPPGVFKRVWGWFVGIFN